MVLFIDINAFLSKKYEFSYLYTLKLCLEILKNSTFYAHINIVYADLFYFIK